MRATLFFAALAFLVLGASGAVTIDNEAKQVVKDAVVSDMFTMVFRDEGPSNGRKRHKPETVATIEFPGYYQFTLKIDRSEGQVIVSTKYNGNSETQYYNVQSVINTTSSRTLVLAVDQRKPGPSMELYVNCNHFGDLEMTKTLREVYFDMKDPQLQMSHDKRFQIQVFPKKNWKTTLLDQNCSEANLELESMPAMQPNAVTEIGIKMPNIGRGDIPISHDCDDLFFVKTIQELMQIVKKLREDVEAQRLEIYRLRQLLERCDDFCRPAGIRNY